MDQVIQLRAWIFKISARNWLQKNIVFTKVHYGIFTLREWSKVGFSSFSQAFMMVKLFRFFQSAYFLAWVAYKNFLLPKNVNFGIRTLEYVRKSWGFHFTAEWLDGKFFFQFSNQFLADWLDRSIGKICAENSLKKQFQNKLCNY